jgi:hypothetical protein
MSDLVMALLLVAAFAGGIGVLRMLNPRLRGERQSQPRNLKTR